MEKVEQTAIMVSVMNWETLQPHELAAAYLAVTLGSSNTIPENNVSFAAARDLNLIDENGRMHELTRQGLEIAVSRLES